MTNTEVVRIEDLLEHLPFARALAKRLVHDPGGADDVVQESYRKALEKPPSMGPDAGSLRAWFGRVIQNTAREQARSGGRRERRERASAREEALPSAADLTERAEAQRLMFDVLLMLDEQRRRIVMLRFHEGLSSAEIARRLDLPAGTVRWLLKTGLNEMRQRLDARTGGDRSTWQRALLPLAAKRIYPSLTLGGAMASAAWFKFAAVGFLISAITLWWVSGGQAPRGEETAAFEQAALTFPEGPREGSDRRKPLDERLAIGAEVEFPDVSQQTLAREESAQPGLFLSIRFVDEAGAGVSGVEVTEVFSGISSSVSDHMGQVELELADRDSDLPVWIAWQHADYASDGIRGPREDLLYEVPSESASTGRRVFELGQVVLRPGASISGTVVDESGLPMPGLLVFVPGATVPGSKGISQEPSLLGAVKTRADEFGRFTLNGLLTGEVEVQASSDDLVDTGRSERVDLSRGGHVEEVVVAVSRTPLSRRVEGQVVDEDGRSLANVRLKVSWKGPTSRGGMSVLSESDGRFRLAFSHRPETIELTVPPSSAYRGWRSTEVRAGTTDLEVRLESAQSFEVVLTGPPEASDESLAWVTVWNEGGDLYSQASNLPLDGSPVELAQPSRPFLVRAGGRGYREVELGPLDPHRGSSSPLRIELEARVGLKGVVLSAEGPVYGATVRLVERARHHTEVLGGAVWLEPEDSDEVQSRADGTFEVFPVESVESFLLATAEGFAPASVGPLRWGSGEEVAPIEIEMGLGGRLKGRVLREPDLSSVQRLLVERGDARPRIVPTDADGNFDVDRLEPGAYRIRILSRQEEDGGWYRNSRSPAATKLEDPDFWIKQGQTTHFDVGEAPALVRGLLEVDFRPDPAFGEEFLFRLLPRDSHAGFDAGREVPWRRGEPVQLELPLPGPANLQIRSEAAENRLLVVRELDVVAGEQRIEFELLSGRVTFAGAGPKDGPIQLAGKDERQNLWYLMGLATETTSVAFPAGEVYIVEPKSLGGTPDRWTIIGQDRLEAGGDVRLERP